MRKVNNFKELFLLIFIMGMTSISGFGCSSSTEKWQEEVQLSDGRIIIVDRETLRERGGGEIVSNRSGTKPKEHRMRFVHPDGSGKVVEWRGTKKEDRGWPEVPLILDLEEGRPIVYTSVGTDVRTVMYSKYVYQDGIWREEELPETFPVCTTNLFLRLGVDMPKYVDLEIKRKENKSVDYDRALKQVGSKRHAITR